MLASVPSAKHLFNAVLYCVGDSALRTVGHRRLLVDPLPRPPIHHLVRVPYDVSANGARAASSIHVDRATLNEASKWQDERRTQPGINIRILDIPHSIHSSTLLFIKGS